MINYFDRQKKVELCTMFMETEKRGGGGGGGVTTKIITRIEKVTKAFSSCKTTYTTDKTKE